MHRYPALASGTGNGDGSIGVAINAAAKRGAEGCIGVALENRLGVAAKSWDGLWQPAEVAVVAALDAIGEPSGFVTEQLGLVGRPTIRGGSEAVGEVEPRVDLQWV